MSSDAINVLYDIKAATFKNAAPLPHKEEVQAQWQGLGFLVGGTRLVSKIGDVTELLQMPKLTPLPAVKSWVKGIANIRGRLVPIVDLHDRLECKSLNTAVRQTNADARAISKRHKVAFKTRDFITWIGDFQFGPTEVQLPAESKVQVPIRQKCVIGAANRQRNSGCVDFQICEVEREVALPGRR